jgi:hypothetical protein
MKDPEMGRKERVGKLLLEIPVRELHNDIFDGAKKGDVPEIVDRNGKVILYETKLQEILPLNLRRATLQHKQMCGCEVCHTARMLQESLNSF